MGCCKKHQTRLTPREETAMDAAAKAMIDALADGNRIDDFSMVRVTAALASQTAGYYSAQQLPLTKEGVGHLRVLKERHFEAAVGHVAETMKTIGSA